MERIRASDSSVLVVFGDEISPEIHRKVARFTRTFRADGVRNLHPGYCSVLVSFDPLRTDPAAIERAAAACETEPAPDPDPPMIEIPVCYGGEFGPDLSDVAAHNLLNPGDVVTIHSSAEYLVYFLGFSPGFPYLGGMPESIATPRLPAPRTHVPAGSVAIGGSQTGIYPVASPGGWRIIGRTPLRLFDPAADPPALLQIGYRVRFVPVPREEFERLSHPR